MAFGRDDLQIIDTYRSVVSSMPLGLRSFVSLFLVVFNWWFILFLFGSYTSLLEQKTPSELNLKRFNKSEHPFIVSLLYYPGVSHNSAYLYFLLVCYIWDISILCDGARP